MTPDLALLTAEAWRHFAGPDDDESDALDALRARLGPSYSDSPEDEVLTAALERAVAYLERATGRVFTAREGTVHLDGTGDETLFLPLPIVSSSQLEGATVAITIGDDDTELDTDTYVVNDGIGVAGNDPRDRPVIEFRSGDDWPSGVSSPPSWEWSRGKWPRGGRNIHVTATWGYVDAAGLTPELARQALAHLVIRMLVSPDDPDGRDDLRAGALLSESVQGRSWTLAPSAASAGLTGDRELDLLVSSLRAPPAMPRANRFPVKRRINRYY